MNRTIKGASVTRFYYETHEQLQEHLANFVDACNFARRLKTLQGLTPYEFVCKRWTIEVQRFSSNPLQQMQGINSSSPRESHGAPSGVLAYAVVVHTIGRGFDLQAKRVGSGDEGRRRRLAPVRQHGPNHVAGSQARLQRLGAARLQGRKPKIEHGAQNLDEPTVAIGVQLSTWRVLESAPWAVPNP